MPWRWRGNRRFFYQTVRAGPRVVGLYVGNGAVAEAVAAQIEQRKAVRIAHREALAALNQAYDLAVAPLLQLDAKADDVMNQAMTAAGFYRHDRGAWRKRKR